MQWERAFVFGCLLLMSVCLNYCLLLPVYSVCLACRGEPAL